MVNEFDEGDDLTVLKNQGMGLRTVIPYFRFIFRTATIVQFGPESSVRRTMNIGEAFASREIMIRERHIEKSTAEGRDSWTVEIKITSDRLLYPG